MNNMGPPSKRVTINLDCYTNPLNWETSNCTAARRPEESSAHVTYQCTNLNKAESWFESINKASEDCSCQSAPLLIDSLSTLLLRHRVDLVCRSLHLLKSSTKVKYFPILVTVHEDLHDEFTIKSIENVATSIIQLIDPPKDKLISNLIGSYVILQKRKSGKVSRIQEHYRVDGTSEFVALSDSDVRKKDQDITQQQKKDPMIDLSFNMGLTEEQKSAKERVILPYVHQGQGTQEKSVLIDEDDTFESDPDEDLDI